jgi:hypothetical protein
MERIGYVKSEISHIVDIIGLLVTVGVEVELEAEIRLVNSPQTSR